MRAINLETREIAKASSRLAEIPGWFEHDIDPDHESEIKFHQRMLDKAWEALEDEINERNG